MKTAPRPAVPCPPAPGPVFIVGAGRVGTSLALALRRRRRPVTLLARRADPAGRDARNRPSPPVSPLADWRPPAGPALLFLAVPDDAIAGVAAALARRYRPATAAGWAAFHLSGAETSRLLAPLRRKGMAAGSWHPLQTFAAPDPALWKGIPVALEGDPQAVAAGRDLAARLGAEAVEIPAGSRALYHCLSTISCAHVAAQLLLCHRALPAFPESARAVLWEGWRRLAIRTLAQLDAAAPWRTVTGPAARGDWKTVELHRAALARSLPEWQSIYAAIHEFLEKAAHIPPGGDPPP